ncbi:Atu4866 domain-containing protein [Algihabitans albus]|uniref:Atu4866 domain-containing protein n=1 Tax=Algihabitans albus TaxID=2164067 RepID=UPI000E5D44A3
MPPIASPSAAPLTSYSTGRSRPGFPKIDDRRCHDTGFAADGEFRDGVLYHTGLVRYRR